MIVYGSYLPKHVNIPKTAAQVAMIDTGIAFGAGLLILPAMFVAQKMVFPFTVRLGSCLIPIRWSLRYYLQCSILWAALVL